MNQKYQILLFYCYEEIKDTEKFKSDHHLFCIENNIFHSKYKIFYQIQIKNVIFYVGIYEF